MREDEFIDAVQRRTQVESRDIAHAATNATLTIFGQRLAGGEAENIASQLPERLDAMLTSEGIDASSSDTEQHSQGVLPVLGNAVSGSELDDARNQLPSEFESLFEPIDMSEHQL